MSWWLRWGTVAFGVGLGLVPSTGRAEESAQVLRTVVLMQPVAGYVGQIGANVEHALSEHVALAASAQVNGLLDTSGFTPTWDITTRRFGAGLEPGVHFYLAGRAPEGFWVGPHLEASVFQHHITNEMASPQEGALPTVRSGWRHFEYGGSVRAGYTAILSPGFSAQVGLGLAVLARETTSYSNNVALDGSVAPTESTTTGWAVAPRMSVGLGWAF